LVRTALEGLALKYRWCVEKLEELGGQRLEVLHIVGGGSKNELLNQLSADALNRPVITGPVEATAAGNILMQMLALGDLKNLAEGRALIRASFETRTWEPRAPAALDEAYARFLALLEV
jgi:rhamnulokinase